MLHVPGRPQSIQIKATGPDDAVGQISEAYFPINALIIHKRADVAVALLILDFLKLLHQIIDPVLKLRVALGRVHQANSGKIMSGYVAGKLSSGAVPTAIWFGCSFQSGAQGAPQEASARNGASPDPATTRALLCQRISEVLGVRVCRIVK